MLGRCGRSAGSAVTHPPGPGLPLGGQARSSETPGYAFECFCSALSGMVGAGPPAVAARAGAGLPAQLSAVPLRTRAGGPRPCCSPRTGRVLSQTHRVSFLSFYLGVGIS